MKNSKKIQCPRCGGNGEVEHTHVMYGICFMCKGEGMVYPIRVDELTEKGKIRKANKIAKKEAEAKAEAIANSEKWEKIYDKIYDENLKYYHIKKNETTAGSAAFIKTLNGLADLVLTKSSSELDVRKFISDYFKTENYSFRYQLSKWTEENYDFIFMEIYRDDFLDDSLRHLGDKIYNN